MDGTSLNMALLLVACVLGGAIHHLVMLCVFGAKAAYAPFGALIVVVGFSQLMPCALAACLALIGHVLLELISRHHRSKMGFGLVVDNTK